MHFTFIVITIFCYTTNWLGKKDRAKLFFNLLPGNELAKSCFVCCGFVLFSKLQNSRLIKMQQYCFCPNSLLLFNPHTRAWLKFLSRTALFPLFTGSVVFPELEWFLVQSNQRRKKRKAHRSKASPRIRMLHLVACAPDDLTWKDQPSRGLHF